MVRHSAASLTKPEGEVHKLSLLCELDGLRPGSLYEGLAIFAKRGINLVRIESRPTKGRLGEYKFFFDLDMSTGYDNVSAAVEEFTANGNGSTAVWHVSIDSRRIRKDISCRKNA